MDTVLKQRLIGAVIIVTLAVIFLPMLAKKPAPESGVESVSLDVPAPPTPMDQPSQEMPLVSAHNDAARLANDVSVQSSPAAQDHQPAIPIPQSPSLNAERGGLKPVLAAGEFAVHLGVLTQASQAEAIARRLRQANLAPAIERIADGPQMAWRVALGPYRDQAQAQAARVQAAALVPGYVTEVVVLDAYEGGAELATANRPAHPLSPQRLTANSIDTAKAKAQAPVPDHGHASLPRPEASASASSLSRVGFAIQVGAYSLVGDANALRDRLRAAGFSAFVESVQTAKGPLYRVRVGPVTDHPTADQLKAHIATKLGVNGLVRPYP